jgi:hypothetical protein
MRDMRLKPVLIGAMFMFLVFLAIPGEGVARVDINIGISPPPLVFSGPPEVAVIPGTYVYFCPDVEGDLFFYGGYWYRGHEGRWFRAANYGGPWVFVLRTNVPEVLFRLPPNYRTMSGYRRIPYRDLSRNWKTWQRDKYWERHGWGRREGEREREHGVAPGFRGRERERHDFNRGRERER